MAHPPSFESVGKVIKGAAALLAIVPGIAVITKTVTLPGSLQEQIGAIALFLGVIVVLATWLFGQKLRRLKPHRAGYLMITLAVIGIASALFCASFTRSYTISDPDRPGAVLVKPMNATGQLAADLERFEGRYDDALRHPSFASRVRDAMAAQANVAIWIMVSTFLIAQVFLLAAIVIGAWKVAETFEKRAPA